MNELLDKWTEITGYNAYPDCNGNMINRNCPKGKVHNWQILNTCLILEAGSGESYGWHVYNLEGCLVTLPNEKEAIQFVNKLNETLKFEPQNDWYPTLFKTTEYNGKTYIGWHFQPLGIDLDPFEPILGSFFYPHYSSVQYLYQVVK